jgi:DNA-directed RNA polymerase specialized sigma24 family protein
MTVEDEILLTQVISSHTDALGVQFQRYFGLVFDTAGRILRNEKLQTLFQEVFIEVHKKVGLYDPQRGSVKTWTLQYAYHRFFNRRTYLVLVGFYGGSGTVSPAEVQPSCKPNPLEHLSNVQ